MHTSPLFAGDVIPNYAQCAFSAHVTLVMSLDMLLDTLITMSECQRFILEANRVTYTYEANRVTYTYEANRVTYTYCYRYIKDSL